MKHEIEADLPEGWRAVAYMVPREGVDYVLTGRGVVELCDWEGINPWLVVEKIKPRRIVLEETAELAGIAYDQQFSIGDSLITVVSPKIWLEVKGE